MNTKESDWRNEKTDNDINNEEGMIQKWNKTLQHNNTHNEDTFSDLEHEVE